MNKRKHFSLETSSEFIISPIAARENMKKLFLMFTSCCLHIALNCSLYLGSFSILRTISGLKRFFLNIDLHILYNTEQNNILSSCKQFFKTYEFFYYQQQKNLKFIQIIYQL